MLDKTNRLEGGQKPPKIQKGKFKENLIESQKKALKMFITDRNSLSNISTLFKYITKTNLTP